MKIISLYPNLSNVGGAQKMLFDIHIGIANQLSIKNHFISSFDSFDELHPRYKAKLSKENYLKFNLLKVKCLNNAIILSHHRKTTTYLMLISKLFGIDLKLIHVAHNEFSSLRKFTIFPRNIIAVSNRVKKNHIEYFGINNIDVIYNGIIDMEAKWTPSVLNSRIRILYPARITSVKRQLEVVELLKGKIPKDVEIHFAGEGEDYQKLKMEIENIPNFKSLGYIEHLRKEMRNYHFVMLLSKKEGLPVSLIEACSVGIPIVCNDVGGNKEVVQDGYNGYVVTFGPDLIQKMNSLTNISPDQYENLSSNSRRVFKKKFKYEKMVNDYAEYIMNLSTTY